MNTENTPAITKTNPRENFGIWAGGLYVTANLGLTFKGTIDTALAENKLDLTSVVSDPLSLINGLTFLAGGLMLMAKGDNNKWAGWALGISTVGFGMLAGITVADHHAIESTVGALVGGGACGYSTYQAYKRETAKSVEETAIEQPEKKNKIAQFFSDTAETLTEKYPFWALGIFDVASNAAVASGAVGVKDYVMLGIAGLWTAGSILMGLALPKVTDKLQPS